jgi:hypothetical protein
MKTALVFAPPGEKGVIHRYNVLVQYAQLAAEGRLQDV